MLAAAAFLCLLMMGVLSFCQAHLMRQLVDQEMAKRWSDKKDVAQISAFYGEGVIENSNYFRQITTGIDQALINASISSETDNPDARLWIDAVSRQGQVSLKSKMGQVEIDAVGTKGEFFLFHPLQLVSGSYISERNLMKDGVMIDEETAWQLFGSSDVAGQQVELQGVPHIVVGVYKRPQGRIQEAAGLKEPLCFLGIDSLEQYGSARGGYFYEIVLPNPIKGFALSTMNTVLGAENTQVKLVENTTRYQTLSLLKVLQSFGIRSMTSESIVYPYWENVARGYEDIFALILLIKILLLIYPLFFTVAVLVRLYKKKKWTLKGLVQRLMDMHYEMGTRRVQRKQEKEEGTEPERKKRETEEEIIEEQIEEETEEQDEGEETEEQGEGEETEEQGKGEEIEEQGKGEETEGQGEGEETEEQGKGETEIKEHQ